MGLFDFFTKKATGQSLEDLNKEIADIKLALTKASNAQSGAQEAIKEKRKTLAKPLMYRTSTESGGLLGRNNSGEFIGPIYDLGEIARAIDIEPYVNQSVRKHREAILKEGFYLKGSDEEMVAYVKNRFFEMDLVSGTTLSQVIREFTTNLVAYGTALLVIKRDSDRSSGSPIRMYGKTLDPTCAVYPLDPTSVSVHLNKHGHPVRWKQQIDDSVNPDRNTIFFEASDVLVATIDKKPGFVFGTPYILPVLDDVRSLRRLEEITEVICQKHAFPLFHFKVGEKDNPAMILDDGTSEIDIVRGEVENMPSEGGIVTSHRVEIDPIGAEQNVLDMQPYLEYFESRVLAGLRLSELDLGRGNASRSSAQSISQGLEDSAKDFQSVISDAITNYLILPILLEGGYDVTPDNMVEFIFPMINREEERASQTHGAQLFAQGVIANREFRRDYLGKEALTDEDEEDTMLKRKHQLDLEILQMQGEQAAAARKETEASKAEKAASNATSNASAPANQYGKKETKTRITANNSFASEKEFYRNVLNVHLNDCQEAVSNFYSKHGIGGVSSSGERYDCTTKDQELTSIFDAFTTFSLTSGREVLEQLVSAGIDDAMSEMDMIGSYTMSKKIRDRFYKNYVEKSLKKLNRLTIDMLNGNDVLSGENIDGSPVIAISSIFEQIRDELSHLVYKHVGMAYKYGFARTAKAHGYSSIFFLPQDNVCGACHSRGAYEVSLMTKDMPYSLLLNTHSNCDFLIDLGKKNN